jgi:hypothetical protein
VNSYLRSKFNPWLNKSTISFFAASSLGVQNVAEIEYEPVCVSFPKKKGKVGLSRLWGSVRKSAGSKLSANHGAKR